MSWKAREWTVNEEILKVSIEPTHSDELEDDNPESEVLAKILRFQ